MTVASLLRIADWIDKADENIERWGIQHPETVLAAITEELGEVDQAYLEATYEDADREIVEEEVEDLGALLLQLLVSLEEHPAAYEALPVASEIREGSA